MSHDKKITRIIFISHSLGTCFTCKWRFKSFFCFSKQIFFRTGKFLLNVFKSRIYFIENFSHFNKESSPTLCLRQPIEWTSPYFLLTFFLESLKPTGHVANFSGRSRGVWKFRFDVSNCSIVLRLKKKDVAASFSKNLFFRLYEIEMTKISSSSTEDARRVFSELTCRSEN